MKQHRFSRILVLAAFLTAVLLPVACFNFTPDSVSLIDNRKLAENPLRAEGDLTTNVENYVNDRIGLRDTMISAYTVLNDRLFGKMVHPSYTYGKDGCVFGGGLTTSNPYGEYHEAFADMVLRAQTYCESRGIPFLFVFNPAKPALYQDQIAAGVNYDRAWVDQFLAALEERGVRYLDNTVTLEGVEGFNLKFDANHWNDLGAYYGTRAMLEALSERMESIHLNDLSEFHVSQKVETSLLVSNFPINETVPEISLTAEYENQTALWKDEIDLHPSYRAFGYYTNSLRAAEGAPRALVLQGSYMNNYGWKYMVNAFSEYIHVHDYQNILELPYYVGIFQPDCVIFEVAEYTLTDNYFSLEGMKALDFQEAMPEDAAVIPEPELTVQKGETITELTWHTAEDWSAAWLELDGLHDLTRTEEGWKAFVSTARYEQNADAAVLRAVE